MGDMSRDVASALINPKVTSTQASNYEEAKAWLEANPAGKLLGARNAILPVCVSKHHEI